MDPESGLVINCKDQKTIRISKNEQRVLKVQKEMTIV